jgi:bifunctional non-homologous end joining protein LigD
MNQPDDDTNELAADPLAAYRGKRSPDRTPEPFGLAPLPPGNLFVVHKHAARQLHYDLRLEMDGVLRSWAVPKGPSCDPAEKRLAVRVEDHPLEYADFEGVIPRGNYGAGGIIIWDRGQWFPLEDPAAGLEKGKLLFELRGYKLHGRWTLVKIKKSERDWLLIKERDHYVQIPGDVFPEESLLSGLTVEELRSGVTRSGRLQTALERAGAPKTSLEPHTLELMLAESAEKAFTRDGWVFELKLDGYRMLGCKRPGSALLLSRNGNDYTAVFPEIVRALQALPLTECIVDGEIVALDERGLPSFALLQQRARLTAPLDVRRAALERPVTYFVFDFLAGEGFDIRPLPLLQRKKLLAETLPKIGPLRYLDHVERQGEAFLARVSALGLEGIMAKRADAAYTGGRSSLWLKIKVERTAEFVIAGFTEPQGNRPGIGALQLADYVDGQLVYAGRVGSGFSEAELRTLRALLEPDRVNEPVCLGPIPLGSGSALGSSAIPDTASTTWVAPRHVCEVRFREWTPDGLLRHAVFVRLREEKLPRDCVREVPRCELMSLATTAPSESALPRPAAEGEPRAVSFSNLQKVFWPEDGYTKGDLIGYYRTIAPWLLAYLADRPLVLTRYPDGIRGKYFYQKDAPDFVPAWIRTVRIWSEDTGREIRYFVCDDLASLLYVVNLGAVPLHVWASRAGCLERPDWCVIDLDPKDAPFSQVVSCARLLREIASEIELPAFVKTTGKTGLHILLPLGRQCTYEQARRLGELLARIVVAELPGAATIARSLAQRDGKVYLDYLQNRHGQTIVAPFSVRPLPGAPVSTPLRWEEVSHGLDPRNFTIANVAERMRSLGSDPMRDVLQAVPDLARALQKLSLRVSKLVPGSQSSQ